MQEKNRECRLNLLCNIGAVSIDRKAGHGVSIQPVGCMHIVVSGLSLCMQVSKEPVPRFLPAFA